MYGVESKYTTTLPLYFSLRTVLLDKQTGLFGYSGVCSGAGVCGPGSGFVCLFVCLFVVVVVVVVGSGSFFGGG